MVASITTQAHVLQYAMLTDNEIQRMSTARMKADNWDDTHEKAWTLTLSYLFDRRPSIEEDDIDDTDVLIPTVAHAAVYCAYQQATLLSDEDKAQKKYWFKKFRRLLAQVVITSDSTELPQESYAGRRSLRA